MSMLTVLIIFLILTLEVTFFCFFLAQALRGILYPEDVSFGYAIFCAIITWISLFSIFITVHIATGL